MEEILNRALNEKLDLVDEFGHTVLHYYSDCGDDATVRVLVDRSKDLSSDDKEAFLNQVSNSYGMTALHWAVFKGHKKVVDILVEAGAKISVVDNDGHTALHYALLFRHDDIASVLVEKSKELDSGVKKAFLNQVNKREGVTALTLAVKRNKKDIVAMLFSEGAEVNIVDNYGLTSFHYAAVLGYEGIVSFFIEKDIDSKNYLNKVGNNNSMTALHLAAMRGEKKVVYILVKAGAEVNLVDKYGYTPLEHALRIGDKDIIDILTEAGAKVDLDNYDDNKNILDSVSFLQL